MKEEYPCFKYNKEVFIIIPGFRFTRNELKTRLKIMGIEDTNNLNKQNIIDLYETALKNNQNKLKILPQLRKDTDNVNAKLSQRQSLPPNMISTNSSQNKIMNIACEIKPFSSSEQQINIYKPIHTNKFQYSTNPFISSNVNQNQSNNTFNYEYSLSNNNQSSNINNNNEKNDNINLNSTYNFNNTNSNNNSSFISNQENNNKNKNNSNISNNNYSRIFNQEVVEQINRESNNSGNIPNVKIFKNSIYNENRRNNANFNNNIKPNNQIISKQYEEDKNNNFLFSKNNNNTDKRFTYQENNNIINNNNDYNNINGDNRKTYTNMPEQSQYLKLTQRLPSNDNILDNSVDNKNPYDNLNNNNNTENINYNNDINNNDYNISIKSQRKPFFANGENNNIEENDIRQTERREPDEVSNFSFFSAFNNIRKYPFYKNRKFIFFHTIILLLILCLTIATLHLINYSWDSIADTISYFSRIINSPEYLLDIVGSIGSFIASIFFGAINYFYITIPLIIFAFIGYISIKKYFFKKKIRELLKQIIKDLDDNSISNQFKAISEDNIYEKYLKNKGVSYAKFVNKYLPVMRKMRRDEPRLKLSQIINNNQNVVFWELNE